MPSAAAPDADLTVERIVDAARLPAVAAAWDALLDERAPGAVFRSSAWLLPWWNAFSAGKELRVHVVWSGARMLGALPAYHVATPLGGRRLRLLGDGIVGSDHLGVVARPADEARAAAAIAGALVDGEEDIELDGVDDDDPLVAALAAAATVAGARFERVAFAPSPLLSVDGDFAGWLGRLPGGAGAQLERRRRWLLRRPGHQLRTVADEAAIGAALDAMWRLHDARWAGRSDAVDGARVLRFHRASAEALARRGWARVFLLDVEGATRAALYGFERGGRFAFYQSGHEPAWRPRSVGTVVLGAAIQHAFDGGLREFDFLRGDEAYKATFASGRRQLLRLRVARGARARALAAGRAALTAARGAVRPWLPEAALDWWRHRRRNSDGERS